MHWERPPNRPQGPGNFQDLEEILRRLKERFKLSPASGMPIIILALVALVAFAGLHSYYTVEPQETAVVKRFGKFIYTRGAGLHFKIPFGVDTVHKVVTGRVLQREYGYRTIQPDSRSRMASRGYEEESIMLSGDLNVVDLQWTVQYKVEEPVSYLFRVHDVEGTLDDISESVIRRIVGNRYSDDVLTVGRASIAEQARVEIQEIMDEYRAGLRVVTVQLQNVNPPQPVRGAFNEVNESQQEKERMINEAQQAYNQRIPRAQGQARQTITQAEGYALERVNRAEGEVRRFKDILAEYERAPDVTRRRMYIEAFETLSNRVERLYVLEQKQSAILPHLDIGRTIGGGSGARSESTTEAHVLQAGQEGR